MPPRRCGMSETVDWTDPEQVAQWWGPRGFTLTTHSKDIRPGGHWDYTMHGPDGVNYPNQTKYHEVEECSKLVYDHGGNDGQLVSLPRSGLARH